VNLEAEAKQRMSGERLEASLEIDRLSTLEVVRLVQAQDRTVADAVAAAAGDIARAVDAIAARLREGGRMVYAGAGTSGRLALLDAAELPPTYGIAPERVPVLLAGGTEALQHAVEGAEDDEAAAVDELGKLGLGPADALVGIAASGTTPYTLAAARHARSLGALTVGIVCAEGSPLAAQCEVAIVVPTGPEVILGSTRMKAGTAQKMVLHTLSTGVMIRLGRVYSNLMVDMPATNRKLRARALRMVQLASGVSEETAGKALADSGGDVRTAIVVARAGVSAAEARALLARHGGDLREVLGE
jgi:N-acetylmuramic acid 6-phosphate etherase